MLRRSRERSFAMIAVLSALTVADRAGADDKPAAPPAKSAPQSADACADVRGSARYVGYGYTHLVTLKNGCTKDVECAVWTDVDPEPRTTVRARPGESVEIVTRRGSPAREVTARKACRYR